MSSDEGQSLGDPACNPACNPACKSSLGGCRPSMAVGSGFCSLLRHISFPGWCGRGRWQCHCGAPGAGGQSVTQAKPESRFLLPAATRPRAHPSRAELTLPGPAPPHALDGGRHPPARI